MNTYELVIIGAGPAGLACSIAAKRAGMKHIVLEKGTIANTIHRFPENMNFFSTSDKLAIGNIPFRCAQDRPSRHQALIYYQRVVQHFKLPVQTGQTVTTVRNRSQGFVLTVENSGTRRVITGLFLVVATGFYDTPRRLGIQGEDLSKCSHYFRDDYLYSGHRAAVIGGGNSAAETALSLQQKGAQVTLIHRSSELRSAVKPWVRPLLENAIKNAKIEGRFNTIVKKVEPGFLLIDGPMGPATIPNDFVLFQTGFRPTDGLLRHLGVNNDPITEVPLHNSETLETKVKRLYVCGAILAGNVAGSVFIENARNHGQKIVAAIERCGDKRLRPPFLQN